MMQVKRLSLLLVLLTPFLCILAQSPDFEAKVDSLRSQYHIVGVSIAVVKHSTVVYNHSFGLKNIEKNVLLSNMDIFRIASISKSFSATAIMQLVDAGKLSLDDDFNKLMGFQIRNPKYPNVPITLKMVMSHRSSINDSQGYFNLDGIDPSKNPDYAKCYNDYAPGEGYQYCNLNYNMIGAVIEKYSGERFDNYVLNHILRPLDLYGGYCVDSLDSNRFTTLYEYNDSTNTFEPQPEAYAPRRERLANYVMGYSTPVLSPTGGMKTSALDLARYMIMHMHYGKANGIRIMSKKNAKRMQHQISEEEGYGMAIMHTDKLVPGVPLTGHTGSAYGLYSAMFFNRKTGVGFTVIINGCDSQYENGFNKALKAVVNQVYDSFK